MFDTSGACSTTRLVVRETSEIRCGAGFFAEAGFFTAGFVVADFDVALVGFLAAGFFAEFFGVSVLTNHPLVVA
jgi:hypothetical protein